ncbi:MAG: TspO/MBR family protein [Chitinophagaceae bacterium]
MIINANKISSLTWWQIGLISVVISSLGSLSGGNPLKKQTKIYTRKLKQAPWAPPAWIFAPAWTFNNFFLLLALKRIIELDKNISEKKKLLLLQTIIWLIYFSFNYIYFYKKSPVLAAAWTVTDAALATVSFRLAYKADKKTSFNYIPLVMWTVFASTLAAYQALKNNDKFLHTKALLS